MDEPYELPEGWLWATLGQICSKPQYGWTTSASANEEGLKLLRTSDISSGTINWSTVPVCSKIPEDPSKYELKSGDIVVSRAGSVGISIELTKCPKAIFASYLIRFNTIPPISPRYVSLFLKSPYYWFSIIDNTAGIAIPNVNATKLSNLNIPLPPLNEQHRIVAKLEALLAQLNKSEEHLAQVPQLIKHFHQSVLAAACSGRLTEEWRKEHYSDVEPASELLKGIQEERIRRYEEECHKVKVEGRKKLKKSKNLELQEVNTEGLPELPEKWVWTKIGNLTDLTSGNAFKKREYTEKGIRLLQIANVHFGKIIWDNIAYLASDYLKKYPNLVLKTGDILMALNRPILNGKLKIGVLEDRDVPAILYQRVGRFDFYNNLVKSYFFFYLQSKLFISRLINSLRGIDQPFVNKPKLLNLSFPLPPLPEQHAIVARVEKFFHFADTIEQRYQNAKTHVDRLTQSLLAKAFRGELIPQNPNDEPASVLLERIQQKRAERNKKKKAQRKRSKTLLDYV